MKEVAYKDNTVANEQLPYPVVLYPGFYGSFFGFKKTTKSESIFFCSCAKEAIKNYLVIKSRRLIPYSSNPYNSIILDRGNFPLEIVENLIKQKIPQNVNIIHHLKFKNKICHECNKATPLYRYCVEMYGGTFRQNYGWYVNKQGYEWGIDRKHIEESLCPQEILDLVEIKPKDYFQIRTNSEKNPRKFYEIQKKYNKQQRKIWNIVENEVRRKFGHKKVGESWTSETILYYIIETIFPNTTILRHYRPDFLEGLELDIYIKELNLGIEYQGIQHFQPIKHWGGPEAFLRQRERDEKKKIICEQLNIKLVYFKYDEGLSNKFVSERISHG